MTMISSILTMFMVQLIFFKNGAGATMTTTTSPHNDQTPFIANGSDTPLEEMPFLLSLKERDRGHFCGGVLVAKSLVLTAAHCLDKFSAENYTKIEIIAGEHDLDYVEPYEQKLTLREVMVHPDYVPRFNKTSPPPRNDLAAILVDGVRFTPNVEPVRPADRKVGNITGKVAGLSGWGIRNFDEGKLSRFRQSITLPIISGEACQKFYAPNSLDQGMVCAGPFKGRATCEGDSGGPMVIRKTLPDKTLTRVLVGVTSWGSAVDCGQKPGVYVKISHYHRWIQCASLMRRRGGFTNSPVALTKMFKQFGKCDCKGFVCHHDVKCVDKSRRCDGKNDCGDFSDESNCAECDPEAFRCFSNGRCIEKSKQCDCIQNCEAGEDEIGCEGRVPPAGKFRCGTGQCIPATGKCNARKDCPDGSDELNCPTIPPPTPATPKTTQPPVGRPYSPLEPIRSPRTTPYIPITIQPTVPPFFNTGNQNGGLFPSSGGVFCTLPPNTTCQYCQSLFCTCLQMCAMTMRNCHQCSSNHKTCVATHCNLNNDDAHRFQRG